MTLAIKAKWGGLGVSVIVHGLPPRFQLWSDSSQISRAHPIKIETVHACGAWQRFTMTNREGYLESIEEIPEPHAFTAYLQVGGETYAVDFVTRKRMGGNIP